MKKRPLLLILSLLIIAASVKAADPELSLVATRTFEFGESEAQLGILGTENSEWPPLFYSILPDRSFAVPDYYKSRIVLYDQEGRFIRAIPLGGIVTPRLNYFGTTRTGHFIIFGDSTLFCVSPDGSTVWSAPFPIGVLPGALHAGESAVYFSVFDGMSAKGLSLPINPPYAAADATQRIGARAIPYLESTGMRYGFTIADTIALRSDSRTVFSPESVPADARFLASDEIGRSLWIARSDGGVGVFVFDSGGKSVLTQIIPSQFSYWFWAVGGFDRGSVSLSLSVPSNGMVVRTYRAMLK